MARASRLHYGCPSLLNPHNRHAQLLQTGFKSVDAYCNGINKQLDFSGACNCMLHAIPS